MNFTNLVVILSIILTSDQFIKGLQGKSVPTKRKNKSPLKREAFGISEKSSARYVRPVRQTENKVPEATNTSKGEESELLKSLLPTQVYKVSATDKIVDIDDKASFVEVLLKCAPILRVCLLTSLDHNMCTLSCLFDPFKTLKHTVRVLGGAVESLCSPIGSIFDKMLPTLIEHEEIKRISSFLNILGVTQRDFLTYAQAGSNALPMQLIKYASTPFLDVLKPLLSGISGVISGVQSGFHSITYLFNPICKNADLGESVQKLAEDLISNPFTTDVALGGWFVLINAAELRTGVVEDMFQSILSTIRLFVGVRCSLIEYAETGKMTPCENVLGNRTSPRASSDKLSVDEEVCGALPDLPPVDLHDLLPDIFPKNYDPIDLENEIIL